MSKIYPQPSTSDLFTSCNYSGTQQAPDLVPDHWKDGEQRKHAARVGGEIGDKVLQFCLARGCEPFHMDDLRRHIGDGHAPDSAGRILRLLRQKGLIDYEVISRAKSEYRITAIATTLDTSEGKA